MQVYIVRHGQSQRNVAPVGPHDCPLTEVGLRQSELTGEYLKGKGIERIYASPALRALMTARVIGRALGIRPKAWTELAERSYLSGEPGLSRRGLVEAFPDIDPDECMSDDRGFAEGVVDEPFPALYKRAERVLATLRERHGAGNAPIALVTHAHFACFFVGAALGITDPDGWVGAVRHYNGAVTCVELGPERNVVRFVNAHHHLGDLVTE